MARSFKEDQKDQQKDITERLPVVYLLQVAADRRLLARKSAMCPGRWRVIGRRGEARANNPKEGTPLIAVKLGT